MKSLKVLAACAVLAVAPAWAQTAKFPDRLIRIIVPFAAGGGVDNVARLLANQLHTQLGVSVIVDNRAGANGALGGKAVQTASADGYTLLFSAATHVLAKEGAGALEADVVAILLDPERRRNFKNIIGNLYQALTYSDNPSTASVLRQSLSKSSRDEQSDFSNALLLSHSRKPWLRAFLFDLATHEGNLQWDALDRLGRWGAEAPTKELVQVCAAELQSHVDAELSQLISAEGVETCRRFVGELAGRDFLMTQLREASDFASRWLTVH